jgi:hypothetical protein
LEAITNRKTPNPTQKYINIHGGNTIMLLQELSRDTRTLLNNTHATREQLETFLKVSGLDLGDILYRQSKCELFIDWIASNDELEEDELLFVTNSMIEYLADKYSKQEKYTNGEMLDCYAYDKSTNTFTLCLNSCGTCILEHYNSLQQLKENIYY